MKSCSLSNDSIIAPFGALAYSKYIRAVCKNTAGITSGLVYDKVCFSEKIPLANSVSQAKSPKESPFEQFKSHLSIVTYSNGLLFSRKPLKFKGGCNVSDGLFCICGSGSRHPKLSQDRGGRGVATAGLADREVTSLAKFFTTSCKGWTPHFSLKGYGKLLPRHWAGLHSLFPMTSPQEYVSPLFVCQESLRNK